MSRILKWFRWRCTIFCICLIIFVFRPHKMLPRFFGTGALFGIPSAGAEQWFGEDASWLSQWKGWSLKESQHASDQNPKGPKGMDNLCWFVDILRFHCIFSMIPKSFGLCGWVDQGHVWRRKLTQKIYSLEMLHQLRATQITSNVCRYRGYVLDAGNECPPSAALSVSQCWNCKQNLSGSYSNSQPHCTSMEGSKSQRSWIHMLCLHQPTSPVDPED